MELFSKVKNNTTVARLVGGASDKEISDSKKAQVIFTTFAYSSTGVDINKQTAILLLTTRKAKLTQILGRILRIKSDRKITRYICDIVDNYSFLKKHYYDFRKPKYVDMGFKISEF